MVSRRMVFVTTELHPETPGGAGVVVDALARELGGDRECTVVLLSSEPVEPIDRPGVRVVTAAIPESGFLERSEAAAEAVARFAGSDDRIEVQDFEGIGFSLLAHRSELGLESAAITVRFHGPYDQLSQAMDTTPLDWAVPSAMEREVFRMADAVLIPADGHRSGLVSDYGVEPERILLTPPPIPELNGSVRPSGDPATFAIIGRLGEMKGSPDMVTAALSLLDQDLDLKVRFIGGDGWSPTAGTTMMDWLTSMVPVRHRDSFEFVGHVPRDHLPQTLSGVTAVVVPSRFESFCLVAHEARRLGLPVVVPDLAAFSDLFDETTGALVYDGSVEGLASSLERLITDPGLAGSLGAAPPPTPTDTWAAYTTDPEPRHPRSQAGLATAATQRVEKVASETISSPSRTTLDRLYRLMPVSLAKAAARLTPRSVKERLGTGVGWAGEEARRNQERRLKAIDSQIEAGEFDELAQPDVSVVIPVFNDVQYLEETLASVYEQTHPSWEIVVVDDGSSDPDALRFLDALDRPRLRLIRQENKGLPGARNTGMAQARGQFLVPLDSDDELEPEFMARMLATLEEQPHAAYAHCYARLYHDIDAIWIPRPFNPYWQLLGNGVVGCVLLRKEAWAEVGGYDETMTRGNEDWELWLRLMAAGWEQAQVPEVLFRYRKHGVSMSVVTEGQFEEGRRMVRNRHPELYAAISATKSRWYPLMTIVGKPEEFPPGDSEIVDTLESALEAWGKYVVDVREAPDVSAQTLVDLADRLEANPTAGTARTSGSPPLVMSRRWNLHDPEAPSGGEEVLESDQKGSGPGTDHIVPREGWVVPEVLDGDIAPIQRQRPEEAGHIVDPEQW